MKIKHTLTRDWKTISGKITETIFEEGEYRSDKKNHYTEDTNFCIISVARPELWSHVRLCVWWTNKENDNHEVSCTYDTEKEAKQVMARINEFTVSDEPKYKEWDYVYVRDVDSEDWKRRIYITTLPKGARYKYVVVQQGYEDNYNLCKHYLIESWKQIKPYKETVKIKTEEWEEIEIEKEKAKSLWFKINE